VIIDLLFLRSIDLWLRSGYSRFAAGLDKLLFSSSWTGLILLPIETPVRESKSVAMLANNLAKKGLVVIVGGQAELRRLALSNKEGGVYLDKTLYSAHTEFYRKLRKNNISVFCDDVEASGCHVPTVYAKARFSQENIDLCSGIFFWGHDDYAAITTTYTVPAEKAFTVGSFRTHYWNHFAAYFGPNLRRKEELISRLGSFIFIPSNFGGAMRPDGVEGVIKQAATNYPSLLPLITERVEHIERRRKEFTAAVNKLVDEFPETNFVFRPHPNEKIEKWRHELVPRNNLIIEYEGTVTEYIMAAAAVLHSGCTSAFEAHFYNTPSISFVPNKVERWDRWQANSLSNEAADYGDLVVEIREILKGRKSVDRDHLLFLNNVEDTTVFFDAMKDHATLKSNDCWSFCKIIFRYLLAALGRKLLLGESTKDDKKFTKADTAHLQLYIKEFAALTSSQLNILRVGRKLLIVLRR